jgi:bifunctional DNase/RNase
MRVTCLALSLAVAIGGEAASDAPANVEIQSVDVALTAQGPVVLLKARGRAIPIFVDEAIAASIHSALTGQKFPRPLSHDLMKTILEAYAGKVTRVGIHLEDGVFHAELTTTVNGTKKVFDSRSSDAIALALRFKAPIVVSEELLDSAGKMLPGSEGQAL